MFLEIEEIAGDDGATAGFGVLEKKFRRVRWVPPVPGVLTDGLAGVFAGVLVSFGGIAFV